MQQYIKGSKTKRVILIFSLFFLFTSAPGCQVEEQSSPTPTTIPSIEDSPVLPTGTATPPPGDTIAKIQGAGHISPYRNKAMTNVEGVVTVVRFDGFYFQSLAPDTDPATSEGIFVFTETVPSVKEGDVVVLDGQIAELTPGGGYGNLSITTIIDPVVTVMKSGVALPEPAVIGEDGRIPPSDIIDDDTNGFISDSVLFDPENDGIDFYESFEGMLVQVNDAVVVGPTNRYKEIIVLGDLGDFASIRTERGGIVIRQNDFNPERIMLDDKLQETPFVDVGDFAQEPIIGVLDYDFGNFRIQVTHQVNFISAGLTPELVEIGEIEKNLRVASYNVLNLSAVETRRIAVLADQIVNNLASPDIIGFQEIQDNDGSEGQDAVSADLTYEAIIDAILNEGGPQYGFIDIDPIPGGEGGINLGNIRQGFIYRLDRGLSLLNAPPGDTRTAVEILTDQESVTLNLNPGRIDPTNPAFYSSRRPLVVAFEFQGERLFIINNHFNSKGGDRALFGEFQPPLLDSEFQRMQQAQVVHDFVADLLEIDPNSKVIVLGDLNDFQFSAPINTLEGNILRNLVESLPAEARYSYIYEGNSQALDHILISQGLNDSLVSFEILHLNSEYSTVSQFSDHDPLIANFSFD